VVGMPAAQCKMVSEGPEGRVLMFKTCRLALSCFAIEIMRATSFRGAPRTHAQNKELWRSLTRKIMSIDCCCV